MVETYLERADRRSLLGNVYLSKVDTVLPGMEAAFIDAGLAKNGFLYVDEIVLPEVDDRERRQRRINDLIKSGQKLLCQVVKDPMGTKGARMTMDASFAGRFLVFSPEPAVGVVRDQLAGTVPGRDAVPGEVECASSRLMRQHCQAFGME